MMPTPSCHLVFETPFGTAAVLYRENPFSVFRVLLPRESRADLVKIAGRERWEESGTHPTARRISESIKDYFNGNTGTIARPPWKWMDLTGVTNLQQSVLKATADIPYGTVKSYKEVAEAIGRPRACRFVGTALAKNPFPILIPCHRVIRSDSSLGQFGGGADLKRKLIELESRHSRSLRNSDNP